MASQLIDLHLPFAYTPSRNIRPEGCTIHYSGPSSWGSSVDRSSAERFFQSTDHNRCATIWRGYHDYHRYGNGWSGIAYTSGVCPHGVRFEGRGPGFRTGANGNDYGNLVSYATCYIGGDGDPLTVQAKLAYLDEQDRLGVPFRWKHKDWFNTSCAGPACDAWQLQGFPRPDSPQDIVPIFRRRSPMKGSFKNALDGNENYWLNPLGILYNNWEQPLSHDLGGPGRPLGDYAFDSIGAAMRVSPHPSGDPRAITWISGVSSYLGLGTDVTVIVAGTGDGGQNWKVVTTNDLRRFLAQD